MYLFCLEIFRNVPIFRRNEWSSYYPDIFTDLLNLAFYGVLKPPRSGNYLIPDAPTKPLIFISKLNEFYKSSKDWKETIIANIKSKLNIAIITEISDSSDFTDAIDHE